MIVASWKWRQVRGALEKKGFMVDRQTDHVYYRFYYHGKATSIRTKVSHGDKGELHGNSALAGQMRDQLGLPTRQLFNDLLDCPLSENEYAAKLVEQGLVHD